MINVAGAGILSTQRDSSRRGRVGLGFHFLEQLDDDAELDTSLLGRRTGFSRKVVQWEMSRVEKQKMERTTTPM